MTILPLSFLYILSLSPLLESKDTMEVFHAKTGLLSGTVHDWEAGNMHTRAFDLGLETMDHRVYRVPGFLSSGLLCLVFCATAEAEFVDEIQTKV